MFAVLSTKTISDLVLYLLFTLLSRALVRTMFINNFTVFIYHLELLYNQKALGISLSTTVGPFIYLFFHLFFHSSLCPCLCLEMCEFVDSFSQVSLFVQNCFLLLVCH